MGSAFATMTVTNIGASSGTIIGWVAAILVLPVAFMWGRKLVDFVMRKLRAA